MRISQPAALICRIALLLVVLAGLTRAAFESQRPQFSMLGSAFASGSSTTLVGDRFARVVGIGGPVCGSADGDSDVTTTDALLIMQAATGSLDCEPCICEVDGSGTITTTDALLVLSASINPAVELFCPSCGLTPTTIPALPGALLTVSIDAAPGASGSVADGDGNISCVPGCDQFYTENVKVQLTAAAASGSVFDGWSGDVPSSCESAKLCSEDLSTSCTATSECSTAGGVCDSFPPNVCIFRTGQDRDVTASFVLSRTLNVATAGKGTGTVSDNRGQVSCGTDCTGEYPDGVYVVLRGKAEVGSLFKGWSGSSVPPSCEGETAACAVRMGKDRDIVATFGTGQVLTIKKDGKGAGTVTADDGTCGTKCFSCDASCSEDSDTFTTDDMLTLRAASDTSDSVVAGGSVFDSWGKDVPSDCKDDRPKECKDVDPSSCSDDIPTECTAFVTCGDGDCSCSLTMDDDRKIKARFERICPTDGPIELCSGLADQGLKLNCSDLAYVYRFGISSAALTTDGSSLAIAHGDLIDILTYTGTAISGTLFSLDTVQLGDGDPENLGTLSRGRISDNGKRLELIVVTGGGLTFEFTNGRYRRTENLSSSSSFIAGGAAESAVTATPSAPDAAGADAGLRRLADALGR